MPNGYTCEQGGEWGSKIPVNVVYERPKGFSYKKALSPLRLKRLTPLRLKKSDFSSLPVNPHSLISTLPKYFKEEKIEDKTTENEVNENKEDINNNDFENYVNSPFGRFKNLDRILRQIADKKSNWACPTCPKM